MVKNVLHKVVFTVTHKMDDIIVEFKWKRFRLFDQTATQVYHDICLENPTAKVEECKSKPKSKWRPVPMDTVVRN